MLVLCCGLLCMMWLAPELPASRWLHRRTVELPVRVLASLDRTRLLAFVVLCVLMSAGAEVLIMLGSAEMAMALAWQIAVYLDAVTLSIGATILVRAKPLLRMLAPRASSLARRSARQRRRRRAIAPSSANDDDPAPAVSAA